MIELEYIEKDGLLYPNIDTGFQRLSNLSKYGTRRLEYLHTQKPEMYRELLLTGKLAEYCEKIEAMAFEVSEQIQEDYIFKHPLPEENFWMRVSIRMMAQMVADEVVSKKIIFV